MENQVEEKTDNEIETWAIGDKLQRTKSSYHNTGSTTYYGLLVTITQLKS